MSAFKNGRRAPASVKLNVYDLTPAKGFNSFVYQFGLGAFHSGVEVHGVEWIFGLDGGICPIPPKCELEGADFKETIEIGTTTKSATEVRSIISKMNPEFKGSDYDIVNKNCNAFSSALCLELTGKDIPSWVNRMASIGQFFCLTIPAPTQKEQ
eukprot:TRINITY_DN778014_c0_g1_i1.p1 TRINITY_DN778014_c0_g1~~TRINITY_DN778014_c0_g1_i1.p1  ORF type:complete len:154 (-),score=24.39 TRINITY_DN778014_c0_g1_i1:217-678(-)